MAPPPVLDPIATSTRIEDDYRSYLRTSFHIADDSLRHELEERLSESRRIRRGPIVQATPPYQPGADLNALVADGVLHPGVLDRPDDVLPSERPLYAHQEQALRAARAGRNLVVATGTGSGKTECYLLPVLDHLLRERDAGTSTQPGVRALLLYPMNALANDQMKRIRDLLAPYPDLTFGRYVGDTEHTHDRAIAHYRQQHGGAEPLPNELIDRDAMKDAPPHILLTNYAMLEYLLLRPADSPFFDGATGRHWRFVVLDEIHVYDGSRGAELGMLLRRVRDRVHQSERGRLQCFGTSATLGRGSQDAPAVAAFARDLFDEEVEAGDVVQPQRLPLRHGPSEWKLTPVALDRLHDAWRRDAQVADLVDAVQDCLRSPVDEAGERPPAVLHRLLRAEHHVVELQRALETGSVELHALADLMDGFPDPQHAVVELVDLCIAARPDDTSAPLIPARYHLFLRASEGAYVCWSADHPEDEPRLILDRHERCPACRPCSCATSRRRRRTTCSAPAAPVGDSAAPHWSSRSRSAGATTCTSSSIRVRWSTATSGHRSLSWTTRPFARRHLHAAAWSMFERERADAGHPPTESVDALVNGEGGQPVADHFLGWLREHPVDLRSSLERILPTNLVGALDVPGWGWIDLLAERNADGVGGWLGDGVAEARRDLIDIDVLIDAAATERKFGRAEALQRTRKTLARRRVLDFLAQRGVLPKYGFPVDVVDLDLSRSESAAATIELNRDLRMGILEFAPGARVVAANHLWRSVGIRVPPGKRLPVWAWGICDGCGVLRSRMVPADLPPADEFLGPCSHCGSEKFASGRRGRYVIPLFGFVGIKDREEPGEARPAREGYLETHFAEFEGPPPTTDVVELGGQAIRIRMSRRGWVTVFNRGRSGQGFTFCHACGFASDGPPPKRRRGERPTHIAPYSESRECLGATRRVDLGHRFLTNVMELELPLTASSSGRETAAVSALHALLAAVPTIGVSQQDVGGSLSVGASGKRSMVLYDEVPGGAGHTLYIREQLAALVHGAIDRLERCGCGLDTSCYGCLRNYRNQRDHERLVRRAALEVLASLV